MNPPTESCQTQPGFQPCSGCTIEQLRREWRKGILFAVALQVTVSAILIQNFLDEQPKAPSRWIPLGSEAKLTPKKMTLPLPKKEKSDDPAYSSPFPVPSARPAFPFSFQLLDDRLLKRFEVGERPQRGAGGGHGAVTPVLADAFAGGRWSEAMTDAGPAPKLATQEGSS